MHQGQSPGARKHESACSSDSFFLDLYQRRAQIKWLAILLKSGTRCTDDRASTGNAVELAENLSMHPTRAVDITREKHCWVVSGSPRSICRAERFAHAIALDLQHTARTGIPQLLIGYCSLGSYFVVRPARFYISLLYSTWISRRRGISIFDHFFDEVNFKKSRPAEEETRPLGVRVFPRRGRPLGVERSGERGQGLRGSAELVCLPLLGSLAVA